MGCRVYGGCIAAPPVLVYESTNEVYERILSLSFVYERIYMATATLLQQGHGVNSARKNQDRSKAEEALSKVQNTYNT